jgi:hypothetical protein
MSSGGSFKHGYEASTLVKGREFVEQLSGYYSPSAELLIRPIVPIM